MGCIGENFQPSVDFYFHVTKLQADLMGFANEREQWKMLRMKFSRQFRVISQRARLPFGVVLLMFNRLQSQRNFGLIEILDLFSLRARSSWVLFFASGTKIRRGCFKIRMRECKIIKFFYFRFIAMILNRFGGFIISFC